MYKRLYEDLYKGINATGIHPLDLQLLQDKNWVKNKKLYEKNKNMRYIAIHISYCDTI